MLLGRGLLHGLGSLLSRFSRFLGLFVFLFRIYILCSFLGWSWVVPYSLLIRLVDAGLVSSPWSLPVNCFVSRLAIYLPSFLRFVTLLGISCPSSL